MRKPTSKRPWPVPERLAIDTNAKIELNHDEWRALIGKWMTAIAALMETENGGKSDPKPFAGLLRSETRIPFELMGLFAEMIDPKQAAFDGRLILKKTKAASKRGARSAKAMKIAMRMSALIRGGAPTDAAAKTVARELKLKDQRWVYNQWSKVADRSGNPKFWGKGANRRGRKSKAKTEPK